MANEAFFVDGGSYVAEELRRFLKTLYFSADPLGGVISGGLVVLGAGSAVKVKTIAAYILDAGGGAYIAATQADSSPITITPTSTGDRTDTIYAIINDPGSGSTAGEMAFGKVSGGTTIPALAIPLAHVTAHNDGSLSIVDVRTQVESASGHSGDTGWVPVTPLNGWSAVTGFGYVGQLLLRRIGKVCQLLGTIRQPWDTILDVGDSTALGLYYVPAQLPAWATPLYTNEFNQWTAATVSDSGQNSPTAHCALEGSAAGQGFQGGTAHPGRVYVVMPRAGADGHDGPNWMSFSHTYLVE